MGYRQKIRFALLLTIYLILTECAWGQLKPGIVIESTAKYSEGEKAGLLEGDLLLNWSRGDAKGEITSPFDLSLIEIEQAPRGNVTLEGVRGTEKRSWVIGPDDWGIKTRPNLPQNLLSIYLEGQELAKAGKLAQAADRWRIIADKGQKGESSWLRIWLLFHIGDSYARVRQWELTDTAYQEALQQQDAPVGVLTQLLRSWADSFHERGDLNNAEKHYREAFDQDEKMTDDNLVGQRAPYDSDKLACDGCNLTLQECAAEVALPGNGSKPTSLNAAVTINDLGLIARERTDLLKAKGYYCRALLTRAKLAPGSLAVVQSLISLGVILFELGDLTRAEAYEVRALDIANKLAPEGLEVAKGLNALGLVAWQRGDLTRAEEYCRQSLVIMKKLVPGSLQVAKVLITLGGVAETQADFAKAEEYFHQVLLIKEKLSPGSPNNVFAFLNLGRVIQTQGDLKRAEGYDLRALARAKRSAPGSLYVAASLTQVGSLAAERGEYAKAEEYYREALEIEDKVFPDSLYVAELYSKLGDAIGGRGDLATAEEYYRKALAIREKLIPGRGMHADSLAALAGILRRKQQLKEAAPLYEQALNALENQIAVLGGTEEVHASFRAGYVSYYKEYIDLLLTEKRPEVAFQVLERLRARSLLETLALAHLDIRAGVDPALIEKEHELQRSFSTKSNDRIQLLNRNHTPEQLTALDKEIKDILEQGQDLKEQIRASSPAYAALTQPPALTARQVQQELLDDNTILLEYVLGEDRSYVFVVTPSSLATYELPKRKEIERSARHLYQLLRTWQAVGAGKKSAQSTRLRETQVRTASAALSRIVLAPVAGQLQGKRLLIVSDGALQYTPFAALPEPELAPAGDAHRQRLPLPLIAEHEVIKLPSASVLGALRQQMAARTVPTKTVAVLADPVFDKDDERVETSARARKPTPSARSVAQSSGADPTSDQQSPAQHQEDDQEMNEHLTRSLADIHGQTKRGVYLTRLPYTRREAKAILAVVPAGEGMQALDFDANRATATDPQLGQYRIVHFATHGLVDSEHPELSGLVLSLVNKQGNAQNGFLGLEDIYNLNLPADLVVLSACETGLGKEINGEGLIGLTRGFMYAGASRVMASLWKVDDVATAELMRRFYQGVEQQGMRPAAALQKAQVEMWKQQRWRDPYYWAAFELQGEWK